jgi:hypothetical protein
MHYWLAGILLSGGAAVKQGGKSREGGLASHCDGDYPSPTVQEIFPTPVVM